MQVRVLLLQELSHEIAIGVQRDLPGVAGSNDDRSVPFVTGIGGGRCRNGDDLGQCLGIDARLMALRERSGSPLGL
jgi:hypothetical protein